MSAETLPTAGRIAEAVKIQASRFLFAVSAGNPAWDSMWTGPNPPSPPIIATDVLNRLCYARPTIVDFLTPDDAGEIRLDGGARFSDSEDPTEYVRIKLALPEGSLDGQTIREIGLFIDSVLDPALPPGQIIIPPAGVLARGSLYALYWREAYPVEGGDFFARNFVVRI